MHRVRVSTILYLNIKIFVYLDIRVLEYSFSKTYFTKVCFLLKHVFNIFAGTQALVRPGSPHSSISAEDRTTYATSSCLAKALVDSLPNPYDKEALRFKVLYTG